jgi:predicted Zn-dependent protease
MRRRPVLAAVLAGVLAAEGVAHASIDERELGRRFYLEARSELPLLDDPAVQDYVSRIGHRLVDALGPQPFDYHFYVVQEPVLNAFAVPGGYVFVFSGLVARVKNDDELAGVLAHEIGHAHAHHVTRLESASAPWTIASLLGLLLTAVNPVLGAGAMAAAQTAQLRYSRDFEQEADYLGVHTMTKAGYDPHALASFFKELLAEQRLNPAGVPPYMLSHPLTEDRIAHVETVVKSEGLTTPKGRPAASPELGEVRAVARAICEPTEVVIDEYRRAAEAKPQDADRQLQLGRVYQTVGQLEAARGALEHAKALGANVDRPLGAVDQSLKRTPEAKESLERWLARHPEDGWSHLQLGKALADGGDEAGALHEFQRAVALDPDLDEAHRLLGLSLGRKGQEAEGFYQLAVASRLRGELEQAFSHFQQTLKLVPDDSPRHKEVEEALAELRPIVQERERQRMERRRRGLFPDTVPTARAGR